ncbi:hypothetical protein DICVIV_06349 [Dictyocaulus viviparus]|uniref:Uncharacterized protein n=1 Tax=Dictyocaulus viviparus TaxID=29172 RepID=A0A0D8XSC6_DICVI|nr:hypothetical protein DICVIV_06349 [Dictyocaulus viviparus]
MEEISVQHSFSGFQKHTCCCVETGCAPTHKEFSDCVEGARNDTDMSTIVFRTSTIPVIYSTTSHFTIKEDMPFGASQKPILVSSTEGAKEHINSNISNIPKMTSDSPSVGITEQAVTKSIQKDTVSKLEILPMSTTTTQKTTQFEFFSANGSHSVMPHNFHMNASASSPSTRQYSELTESKASISTATSTSNDISTSARHEQNNHILQNLLHIQKPADVEELGNETVSTGTQVTTKSSSETTATAPLVSSRKSSTFTEKRMSIAHPALSDEYQKVDRHRNFYKTPSNHYPTSADSRNATSSPLNSSYDVTTLTAKIEEESEVKVALWSVVLIGFITSVIIASIVVFCLRRKKKHEAENIVEAAENDGNPVDPLLKNTEPTNSPISVDKNYEKPDGTHY